MADASDYVAQLREASRLVAERGGEGHAWELVFQSRSGPPTQPWLEPDIGDHIDRLAADGVPAVVVVPIGFVSDHMEVVYDLDVVAAERAAAGGHRVRAGRDARDRAGVRGDGARAHRGAARSLVASARARPAGGAARRLPRMLRYRAVTPAALTPIWRSASSPRPRRSSSRSIADGRRSSRPQRRSTAANISGSRTSIDSVGVSGVRNT